jgi:hypothetical protein
MTSGTENRPTANSATSAFPRIRTVPATGSNSATSGCIPASFIVSCKRAIACVAFLHLRKRAKHPNLRACSTDRKEVIRCRVISFSRTWPQRIALSGSSLPVNGARCAACGPLRITAKGPRHGRKHGRPPASREAAAFSFCSPYLVSASRSMLRAISWKALSSSAPVATSK